MMKISRSILLLSTAIAIAGAPAHAQNFRYGQRAAPDGPGLGTIAAGLLVLGAVASMAGGGGGGGGNDADGDTFNGPDATDPTPGNEANRASFDTSEYRRNWGLDAINADARYASGGTGLGALGSVFDTGANLSHPDLQGQVRYSHSYFTGTDDVTDTSGHGTFVLGLMGSVKNDIGSHGVAFDSEFAVFQGLDGPGEISILNAWADATTKSVVLGAEVINHSWNFVDENENTRTIDSVSSRNDLTGYMSTGVINALSLAAENDLITVVAAGNSGLDNVGINAGIPVFMPEFEDHMLAVVALGLNDQIAGFSNHCGMAAAFCIAAPGSYVYSTTPDGGFAYGSGTSYAAPHVSGAVLVMASNFPELTGAEISYILRDTARDIGAPGVDEIYGVGALDLENAIAPQGAIQLQTSSLLGQSAFAASESHISTSGGMGAALKASLSSQTILVTDKYDRGYTTQMDNFVGDGADISRKKDILEEFAFGQGPALRLATSTSSLSYDPRSLSSLDRNGDLIAPISAPYAALLEGAGSMSYKSGLGGGYFSISGAIADPDAVSSGSYLSAAVHAPIGQHTISLGMGHLSEEGSFLGTDVSGAFGEEMKANTDFISLSGDFALGARSKLFIGGSLGTTDFSGDGLLKSGSGITTSNLAVGISRTGTWRNNDRFSFSATRDMAVSGGDISVAVPVGLGAAENGVRSPDVAIQTSDISMAKTSSPIDFRIGYETDLLSGRLAIGGGLRGGDIDHRIGTVGYSIRF